MSRNNSALALDAAASWSLVRGLVLLSLGGLLRLDGPSAQSPIASNPTADGDSKDEEDRDPVTDDDGDENNPSRIRLLRFQTGEPSGDSSGSSGTV